MPAARMLRVTILATEDLGEDLVETLHAMSAVELTDACSEHEEELGNSLRRGERDLRGARLDLARADFVLDVLGRREEKKGGFLSSFIRERAHLTYEEFMTIRRRVDLESAYEELEALDIELRHLESRSEELRKQREHLEPWKSLGVSPADLGSLERTAFRAWAMSEVTFEAWAEEMEGACPSAVWGEAGRSRGRVHVAALVHLSELEACDSIAARHGLEPFSLQALSGTVREAIERLERELEYNEVRKERLLQRMRSFLPSRPDFLALHDYLRNHLEKLEAQKNLARTERTVILRGWVEEGRADELRQALGWMEDMAYIEFSPPGEGEEPPVLLKNRRRVKPAENLIELFGLPNSSETDPTPFVAPYFILFFGMCIGDVGYGLILAAAFWLARRKLDVTPKTKSFFQLFMYCGLAAMAVGVFTRGYFGIEAEKLPEFLKFPGSLDVLMNPIPIMIVCIALGLSHISLGVAIEMIDNIRNNSLWTGLCEQGTTLLMWAGLAVTALGAGLKAGLLRTCGIYAMAAGALGVVLLSNIGSRTWAGKVFGGLYNLYGLFASTIGDVASYLRLYALGLATVAIGSVINLMAGMVFKVPLAGVLLLLVVLAGGHLFNLAINFLGAFVHPLRLQYVEFFGKFYEDGGRPFRPFGIRLEKAVLENPD